MSSPDLSTVPDDVLAAWVERQRWFGAKSREVASLNVLDAVTLREHEPALSLVLLEARFGAGTHELYQMLVGAHEGGEAPGQIHSDGQVTITDATADPEECAILARLMVDGHDIAGATATVRFRWRDGVPPPEGDVRPMGAEQSNTSVVFGERVALKVFRRVEPGVNPELEMLRFLSAHDFPNIAALAGWYDVCGDRLEATLGIAQDFVGGGRDGWELALDSAGDDAFLDALHELGTVTGRMHSVLGSVADDPDFSPEEPSEESLPLLTAMIDEEIERVFLRLPDHPALAPIAGRGEEVRDRLRALSHVGIGGRLIRTHGDFHLGQTLRTDDGWVILDFEGEPARSVVERRRKRSPLRDVAGMLRSIAYVASAGGLLRGRALPADWEGRARERFLDGYLGEADTRLLPAGSGAVHKLLSIFELEKAVYELRYELDNRPDWVSIPVAGIARLLEEPAAS